LWPKVWVKKYWEFPKQIHQRFHDNMTLYYKDLPEIKLP
jgi:hypothetical protein